jgi:hypothetical protein
VVVVRLAPNIVKVSGLRPGAINDTDADAIIVLPGYPHSVHR